uniref:Serine/threonine-protein kinase Nek4 n=1 Tax=Tetraodon nigroviridis TaxID=99883 RepID=H3CP87_TETNG
KMMNNYVSIRIVGKGSYGEVNLVKHKTDKQQYVIKKLNLTTSSKRERRAAEQEAQLLSQLRHPNIVTYRESWEGDDCQLYIVMGFCEGGDLYHRLKQQKGELLPERQVVEWFVQIAMALEYLHQRNILHRDLKTQNIFLTKCNIIKVGDLGIARVLENQNDMASTLIGTPYYMSPELFSNKPYNHKSDVWALGCCVYEMSTLKHAFNARDMNSLVYRIVQGKLPQMPSKYDPHLGELIKSMLCKRPEDRPDVKVILRQPYIKRQIALFLEATKEKTAKSKKKTVSSGGCNRASSVASSLPKCEKSAKGEGQSQMKPNKENSQKYKVWNSVSDVAPVQSAASPKPSSPDALKASSVSLATISNVNIDVDENPEEKKSQGSKSVAPHCQAVPLPVSHNEGRRTADSSAPPSDPPLNLKSVPVDPIEEEEEEFVSKGLHIHLDKQATGEDDSTDLPKDTDAVAPRPLPPPPTVSADLGGRKRSTEGRNALAAATSSSLRSCNEVPPPKVVRNAIKRICFMITSVNVGTHRGRFLIFIYFLQDRLTARERRRLKKSQESSTEPGRCCQMEPPTVRYSHSDPKRTGENISLCKSTACVHVQLSRLPKQRSVEGECASSTSSTQQSGPYGERKAESCDIQDLVQMMTQTLRMDTEDSVDEEDKDSLGLTALPEFRLNREYRDTLVLHGKSQEEAEHLSLGQIPLGSTSGPAKIRRAIEHLRTDVVKGLGIKLLDKILEIMEEEDDHKREQCLLHHMGDEKYHAYAVMVRQLKFLEDVAL